MQWSRTAFWQHCQLPKALSSTPFPCPGHLFPPFWCPRPVPRVTSGNGAPRPVTPACPFLLRSAPSTSSCAGTRQRAAQRREWAAGSERGRGGGFLWSATAKGLTGDGGRAAGAKHGRSLHFLTVNTDRMRFHEMEASLALLDVCLQPQSAPCPPAQGRPLYRSCHHRCTRCWILNQSRERDSA